MSIEKLRQTLSSNIVTVTFEKKDGSMREMLCTTMPEYLPEMTGESTSKPSDSLVTVWDLDNAGWRSFRFDSVTSVYVD